MYGLERLRKKCYQHECAPADTMFFGRHAWDTRGPSTTQQKIWKQEAPSVLLLRWPHVSLTLCITITGWVCFFILGRLGWPGKTNRLNCFEEYLVNPGCFCERPRPGRIIAQPANTISNFCFQSSCDLHLLVCRYKDISKSHLVFDTYESSHSIKMVLP